MKTKQPGTMVRRKQGIKAERSAFTLVELVIVIVIMGLLLAVVMPKFMRGADQASAAQAEGNRMLLQNAVDQYVSDHDPTSSLLWGFPGPKSEEVAKRLLGTTEWSGWVTSSSTERLYGPYLMHLPPNPMYYTNDYMGIGIDNCFAGGGCKSGTGPDGRSWDDSHCGWVLHLADDSHRIDVCSP